MNIYFNVTPSARQDHIDVNGVFSDSQGKVYSDMIRLEGRPAQISDATIEAAKRLLSHTMQYYINDRENYAKRITEAKQGDYRPDHLVGDWQLLDD